MVSFATMYARALRPVFIEIITVRNNYQIRIVATLHKNQTIEKSLQRMLQPLI